MPASKVRSGGTLSQYRVSCGRSTDQKLFAEYIRGVRVTASRGTLLANFLPPPYISHTFTTLAPFASRPNPPPTFPRSLAIMADPHQILPGKPGFGTMPALNSPAPSRSGTPLTDYPLAFMAEQLAQARSALRLNPLDLADFSAETLANTMPTESTTVSLLSQLVKGLVTISHELSGVSQKLATIYQENEAIREELHDISSELANLPPPPQDNSPPHALADLQASIRDLSHRLSAPIPVPPQAPAPTRGPHPPFVAPGPGPSKKGKEKARAPPTPTPTAAEDPKYLIPFYDTKLGKACGTPKNMLGCTPTPMRPANTGEAGMTWPLSPLATYTPTTTPPPDRLRLPLAPARAARTREKPERDPTPNKLQVQWPPQVKRGLPPSQVLKVAFFCSSPVSCPSPRRFNHRGNLPRHSCSHPSRIQLPLPSRLFGYGQPSRCHLPDRYRQDDSCCV